MTIHATALSTICAVCGELLGGGEICVSCLLRTGLDSGEASADLARFGDFEIDRSDDGAWSELGRGAMGVTYRAYDIVLNRTVALKVIEASRSAAMRERFLREARAAAALRHPNIAGVFQFGASSDGERCYCAMELVEGETLEALVRRDGALAAKTVLEVGIQVTRALIAAADRGLVHRDLKPGNIMLARSGNAAGLEVKVIDFGLAKAVSAAGEMELTHGNFVGTPAFASPEQFAHGAIDARTDIYALGVTLWFALTGRLPFVGTTIEEIRERQRHRSLPLEQLKERAVPRSLVALLQSCLAVNPAARPASARELMAALESCLTQIAGRHRRAGLAVIALACAMAAALAILFFLSRNQPATSKSGREIVAPAKPTENADAYLLYLRGRQTETMNRGIDGFQSAAQFYEQAIDLDPRFALARARLSICATELSHASGEPEWKDKARSEAEEAFRLAPQLGETRLALGYRHLLEGDDKRAEGEVQNAAELLPNSAEVPLLAAFIYKRQGRFRDRIAALERAESLEPQNATVQMYQAVTYRWVRDWRAAMHSLDRRSVVRSNQQAELWWLHGNDEFRLTSDIKALKTAIKKVDRVAAEAVWLNAARYEVAMLERDYEAAGKFLDAVSAERVDETFSLGGPPHSKLFHEALLAAAQGNAAAARPTLERAQIELESRLSDKLDQYQEACLRADLALIFSFLSRGDDAIREALRALDPNLTPPGSVEANFLSSALAMIYAQTGETEKAISLIEHLLTVPCDFPTGAIYNMTLADLTWRWQWDPLRSHPRFQKLLAGPEPRTIY